jgi:hypothetical protein
MSERRYPALYQVNTRVWLTELAGRLGRPATLDDVPDAELDRLAALGFDWVWFLGVWQTGLAGQQVSRTNPLWRHEFEQTLPDLRQDDIAGSCFAIVSYTAHAELGGDAALSRLRQRLHRRGLRLLLDFVPNHVALDHPWVQQHPEFFLAGSEADLTRAPHDFARLDTPAGPRIFALGRDPYFPAWPDVLQLNYANPALQAAMDAELQAVANRCDGVRCDMAMLILPEIFQRTWGLTATPFWPGAITHVRARYPDFLFLAEVYWDLEWTLQQQGFDYTYDKKLYDRLRQGPARLVREYLLANLAYQNKLARFLENHDEPRAAAVFPPAQHQAAAVITYLVPGLRFFQQGQFEGKKVRVSPHLRRAPAEPADAALGAFYDHLLAVVRRPEVRAGAWALLECIPAWDGNWTQEDFVACTWQTPESLLVIVVNYASHPSQCYVRLPFDRLHGRTWRLTDLLGPAEYDRAGDQLVGKGLYLDLPAWGYNVFAVA